tara:strand:+ start:67 stop:1191 length:1125 start_codon:yes stop_codon:yes gene_type:complete
MFDIYQTFQIDYFNKIKTDEVDYNKIRKELHQYPSFDEKIAIEIKESINKLKNKYHYQLNIKNIKINIFFYSEIEDIELFINLAKIIFLFVSTFGINLDIYDNYNIRLLLIEFPRILDSKHQQNSNSFEELGLKGYFNNSSGVHIASRKELVVSRKSGITGLLIHELIHMLGLDFCFNFNNNNHANLYDWSSEWIKNNNIRKNNNNVISFIESICNTNSSYFVAIFNSIHICNLLNSSNNLIKFFKYFFYLETIYCYVNGVKLLNYFDFNNYDSFFNNTNNRIFYQNALVFEYIILRMFLINDYYRMLLKPLLKVNFNQDTTYKYNLDFQHELNEKLTSKIKKKYIKNIFDDISNLMLKINNNNMEYFPLDFIY